MSFKISCHLRFHAVEMRFYVLRFHAVEIQCRLRFHVPSIDIYIYVKILGDIFSQSPKNHSPEKGEVGGSSFVLTEKLSFQGGREVSFIRYSSAQTGFSWGIMEDYVDQIR